MKKIYLIIAMVISTIAPAVAQQLFAGGVKRACPLNRYTHASMMYYKGTDSERLPMLHYVYICEADAAERGEKPIYEGDFYTEALAFVPSNLSMSATEYYDMLTSDLDVFKVMYKKESVAHGYFDARCGTTVVEFGERGVTSMPAFTVLPYGDAYFNTVRRINDYGVAKVNVQQLFLAEIESIGKCAFANSTGLANIYIQDYKLMNPTMRVPDVAPDAFPEVIYGKCKLHVAADMADAYRAHPVWGRFKNINAREDYNRNAVYRSGLREGDEFKMDYVTTLYNVQPQGTVDNFGTNAYEVEKAMQYIEPETWYKVTDVANREVRLTKIAYYFDPSYVNECTNLHLASLSPYYDPMRYNERMHGTVCGYTVVEVSPYVEAGQGADKVKSIYMHTVRTVRGYAFSNFPGLENLKFAELEDIEPMAFASCTGLKTLTIDPENPEVGDRIPDANLTSFSDETYANCRLIVPAEHVDQYLAHPVWNKFLKIEASANTIYEDCAPTVSVELDGGVIRVNGAAANAPVQCFSLSGGLVATSRTDSAGTCALDAPATPGIYVVRAGSATAKVAVR